MNAGERGKLALKGCIVLLGIPVCIVAMLVVAMSGGADSEDGRGVPFGPAIFMLALAGALVCLFYGLLLLVRAALGGK